LKATISENFINYSDNALQQVVEQCVGKPVNDRDSNQIGSILSGKIVEGTTLIEFEVEII
jgi:hypothetical protein